jgi:predicted dinucleotide-binding enzyme
MKIAIIGSGNVGLALGHGWLKAGHEVRFGVREPGSAKALKAASALPGAAFLNVMEAASDAEVIVLTTPPEAVLELLPALGDISRKVVIDATNSIRSKPEPYPTAFHAVRALAPHAEVVKCFNTTGFENMENPVYEDAGVDMYAAGDSIKAKEIATALSADLGFANCYNFGGDAQVELLEKFALSWINLAIFQGYGRNIAFKLLRR